MTRNVTDWNDVPVLFDMPLACRIFGVQRAAINRWIRDDNMPVVKLCNGSIRFPKDKILQWIEQRSVKKGA